MDSWFFFLLGVVVMGAVVFARRHLAAFRAQTPTDYDEAFPAFELKQHLNGDMICEGVIYGPLGRVTSTFSADFEISWEGDKGVMDEIFRYNDGSTQTRQWRITSGTDGKFDLQADDVPGGGSGTARGHAVQMVYPIKLPEGSGGHVLSCVDWMYVTPDGTIMNRSQFRKFGIKVAELIATIRPKEPT